MEIPEITKMLKDHEKRLQLLEKPNDVKHQSSQKKSILGLLMEAKKEKFFLKKRTLDEILHRFAEKGYTYKRTQSLTEPLQRATKMGIVKREKTESGWVYFA